MVGHTRSDMYVRVLDVDTLREILWILNYKNQNQELASATTSK